MQPETVKDIINELADCCYVYGYYLDPIVPIEERRKEFVENTCNRIYKAVENENLEKD